MPHANTNRKKAGVAILISDRADLRARKIIRDKVGHYIMIKGSIPHKGIRILNVYVPNNRTSKCMRQSARQINKF